MGIDDGERKLHIKPRKTKAEPTPDTKLHIKPQAESNEALRDLFRVGQVFINRDLKAEFEVTRAEGKLGERHIVLESKAIKARVGKGEAALLEAIRDGVWRVKE